MNILFKIKALFNPNALAKETFLKTIDTGAKTIYAMKQAIEKNPEMLAHHIEEFNRALAMGAELRVLLSGKKVMDGMCALAMSMYNQNVNDCIAHFRLHQEHPESSINDIQEQVAEALGPNPKTPQEALEAIKKIPGIKGIRVVDLKTGKEATDIPQTQTSIEEEKQKEMPNKPKRID